MNVKKIHGIKSYQYIREYSQSLRNRGVIKFHHDITFGHDEISMLMEDPEIQEHYIRHKIPVVCTDSSGRILDNGIYINRVLEARYPESMVLFKMLRQVAQNLGSSYGNCSLHYAKNGADCQHLYSLFFDLNTDDFTHFVINNGALIQDLIDAYNFSSRDIILEAASPENRITLPNSYDYFSFRGRQPSSDLNKNISVIHKITGLPTHLSPQRGRCLFHFVSGQSIREISETMQLSPKTIEHYLEILRKELGCRSSKELILHYAHQIRQ